MDRLIAIAALTALGSGSCSDKKAGPTPVDKTETAVDNSKTTTTEPPLAGKGRFENGFFVADGAPAPLACAKADDCVANTVLDASGCCWNYRTVAHSRAYRKWVGTWHATQCADTDCPSPPVPAQPMACVFEMKCVEGSCQNSCSEPAQ